MGTCKGCPQDGETKMQTEPIIIRSAINSDVVNIRRLLHNEGRGMSDEVIAGKLDCFYLLFQGAKLLGAYYHYRDGSEAAGWASVHPLYRQDLVEEIMTRAVNGLFDDNLA